MPFSKIPIFSEFNAFHQAAKGEVRAHHAWYHIFTFKDIGHKKAEKIPLFRTGFYQIGLMTKADFKIHVFEQSYHLSEKHALVFFKPGQLIEFKTDPTWEGFVVMFKEELFEVLGFHSSPLARYQVLDPLNASFLPVDDETFENLSKIYQQLLHEDALMPNNRVETVALLVLALLEKIEHCFHPQTKYKKAGRKTEISYAFKHLVHQHLHKTKAVSEYAEMLHVSPKYLTEAVKDTNHVSPKEYIGSRIYSEVKTLLRHTEKSIYDISKYYNFNDQAHFSKFFKEKEGLSPLDYRNKVRE